MGQQNYKTNLKRIKRELKRLKGKNQTIRITDAPKDCIRTNSGLYINVFKPTSEMIRVEDVAHALSMQPRFGGHLNQKYSVAQHSVQCTMMAKTLKDKREALMHDASEAYLLDIPTPIKAKLKQYKRVENKLMAVIFKKFNLPFPMSERMHKIDRQMLLIEWDNMVVKNNKDFECWSQAKAKREFLKMYKELFQN